MRAQNEKEFKALIKKYESIEMKDLLSISTDDYWCYKDLLSYITGFGDVEQCSLCKNIFDHHKPCSDCIYNITSEDHECRYNCIKENNYETYQAINDSNTLDNLLIAIEERAEYMKKVWKQYLKQRK